MSLQKALLFSFHVNASRMLLQANEITLNSLAVTYRYFTRTINVKIGELPMSIASVCTVASQ